MAAVRLHTYCSEQTNDDEGLYEGLGVSHYRFMINATQSRNSQGGEDGKGNGLAAYLALRTQESGGLQERRALKGGTLEAMGQWLTDPGATDDGREPTAHGADLITYHSPSRPQAAWISAGGVPGAPKLPCRAKPA
ncbi:hypothetical protein E4U52_002914 [Claviceps spartinae]|nr:hypothetical protein E4U52_002914 [Claviceps spartinae]